MSSQSETHRDYESLRDESDSQTELTVGVEWGDEVHPTLRVAIKVNVLTV